MTYVLVHESADDVATKPPEHFPAHRERGMAFREDGSLLMFGAFGDPQSKGSMAVFRTRSSRSRYLP